LVIVGKVMKTSGQLGSRTPVVVGMWVYEEGAKYLMGHVNEAMNSCLKAKLLRYSLILNCHYPLDLLPILFPPISANRPVFLFST